MSVKYHLLIGLILSVFLLASCKKYLNEKPDRSMNIPRSLNDLQRLLDNYGTMNASFPYSTELLADNYYLTTADWSSITNATQKNYYVWQKDDQSVSEWSTAYRVVFYSNVVLNEVNRLEYAPSEANTAGNIRGSALFFRAFSLYSLAQLFAPPYDSSTASQKPGIPLRLNSDFQEPSARSSLQQTYQQVINDFKLAALLLPSSASYSNRPTKAAAYAALARTYLTTEQYNKALYYADSALQLYNTLIDYNTLSQSAAIPILRFNAEVIFPAVSTGSLNLNPSRAKVDTVLYASYQNNDLRKAIFFKSNGNGTFAPKASYDGSNTGAVFTGLTTSELYLVKAEALARLGQVTPAMDALNTLLEKRWKAGTFIGLAASNAEEALNKILLERRKELCFRGQRWTDLRRLNKDPRFATTLFRKLDAQTYTLLPNSNGYTVLIPAQVIDITGMPQNP